MEKADNRKVVVEDLVYIDDLQILIYTTVAPRTSKIFITSLDKSRQGNSNEDTAAAPNSDTQVITLKDLTEKSK